MSSSSDPKHKADDVSGDKHKQRDQHMTSKVKAKEEVESGAERGNFLLALCFMGAIKEKGNTQKLQPGYRYMYDYFTA